MSATDVHRSAPGLQLATLVDHRTGLVTEVERYENPPEWPSRFTMVSAHVADAGWDRPWWPDRVSTGTSFAGLHEATLSAVGEAVERYCGNHVPVGLRRAAYGELVAEGQLALDPAEVLLYAPEQLADPSFPFVAYSPDTVVQWAAARRLDDGATQLVPASLVWVNWFHGHRAGEPRTNFVVYAGLAAGRDRADAERSALEEVIERDAIEVWWRAGAPATGIDLSGRPDVIAALQAPAPEVLTHTALWVDNVWGVPVVAVLTHDREHGLLTLGTAARPDPATAVLKAAGEAISLRSYAKGLLDPDGGPWKAVELGLIDGSQLVPWRADRRYLDSYRNDFGDVTDLACQTQLYLDPRAQRWWDHLRDPARTVALTDLPVLTGPSRDTYLRRLTARGVRPVSLDLTTTDVRAAGGAVVRVLAPGTYTNAPAAYTCWAGDRYRTEPVELGWAGTPLRDDQLNRRPLPHT